jgi:hypothetical protein
MGLALEVAAHALTSLLAMWLGLLVVTRARGSAGAPVFALVSSLLVMWSVAIIGQRLGANEAVHPLLNVAEDFGAFFLPPAVAHLAFSVALEGRRSTAATAILVAGYAVGAVAVIQAALDPAHPVLPAAPHWEPFGISGAVVGWSFIAVRAGLFVAGIAWLIVALRRAGEDVARQRQLQVTIVTLGLGIAGGMARILPEGLGGPAWVGVSLVAGAAVLAVYAVLAQRLFVGADVTARAFWSSLTIGLGVVTYVVFLVLIDRAFAETIGLELPVILALAIVATIALFDPIAGLVRGLVSGEKQDRPSEAILGPALSRLVRTFDLTGAAVVDRSGVPTVIHGELDAEGRSASTRLPLETANGHAAFGLKRSGLPLRPSEIDLLRLATTYVDAAILFGERRGEQASAMADLSRQREDVRGRETALAEALADHQMASPGLHVYALGPLRAEIDGEPVRRWGGAKAGSRQAEAIFAFLFDRGERGAAKDEIIELVWPDVDLDRADTAFHRTMLGLRSMLGPVHEGRRGDGPIQFGNDRYRLAEDVVAWSDVAEFERLLAEARGADPDRRLLTFEAARALYRSELLDDCPYYGDSIHVEERREELRERYVDLLVDLSGIYADRGDGAAAADAMRRARAITGRDLPSMSFEPTPP